MTAPRVHPMSERVSELDDPELTATIETIVDGWYLEKSFDWDEFFDRLETYLPTREFSCDWNDPDIVAIQKYARKVRRESQ